MTTTLPSLASGISGLPVPRRYFATAAMSAGSALVIIDGGIANVALPTIARDLGTSASNAVSVVTIYQVVLVMLMLPFAGLGEKIGLKRTYQTGQVIFTVATLLCFLAKGLVFLLIVRAAQAVGAACVLAVNSALIRQIYPANQLGRGLAINAVVMTSAAAAAPTIGGLILGVAPWPWIFAAAIPFALVSLTLGSAIPAPSPRQAHFDAIGALYCAAMFGLIIGGLEAAVHGTNLFVSAAIVLLGLGVGVRFARVEMGKSAPILPVDLLARPVLALSAAGSFAAFVSSMTLLISTPFRLHQLGFTTAEIGAAIMPWPLTNIVIAPAAGFLSDRVPAGILGGIGMTMSIVALLSIAALPEHAGYFDIAWRMTLCGAGFGLYLPPNSRLLIGSAPKDRAAAAGGLASTVRLTGQTVGATLVAALLAMGFGLGPVPALMSAGLALFAGICSVIRLRPTVREPSIDEVREQIPTLKQSR